VLSRVEGDHRESPIFGISLITSWALLCGLRTMSKSLDLKGVVSLGRATRFSPQGLTGLAPMKRGFLKRETSWITARR
jgi:hypothetical protein